jgi:hypothetical protein
LRPTPPGVKRLAPGVVVLGSMVIGDVEVMSMAAEPNTRTEGLGNGSVIGGLLTKFDEEVVGPGKGELPIAAEG